MCTALDFQWFACEGRIGMRTEEGDLFIYPANIYVSSIMNRALCQVADIKLNMTYSLLCRSSWSSGRTEVYGGLGGGGESKRDCERDKPQEKSNGSTCEGHLLQTEEGREGFLEDLTPELNLKELGKMAGHTPCRGTEASGGQEVCHGWR